MYPVNDICKKAQGQWEFILQRLDISTNRKESPCPACGGNTRYRFDDKEGRGTHHCSHCGAGDGLNLIMKVKHCTAIQGAKMIADILSLPLPERTSKSEEKPQIPIADKVAQLVTRAHMGESTYLNNKGLHGSHYILEDGSLLLPLQTIDGTITGAQIIKPNGEKRLIAGTKKSRSYIPISKIPENPDAIVITEGYATALTVNLLEVGSVVADVDAGNLPSVAEAFRQKYPNTDMYIAGDNDFSDKEVNIGKESANKAALAISAVISIPPTDYKCDWNDYYQKNGFLEFKKAFVDSASLPEEPKGEPKIIEEFKNNVTFLPTSNTDKKSNKKSNPDTFIDIREDGVYLVEQVENEKTGKISILMEEWLCSKMNVVGLGISGREHYIILEWIDRKSNQLIKQGIPLADIGEREGWRTLKSYGIKVTTKSKLRTVLADWLQCEAVGDLWSITPRSGWHNGAYIMPDGSIIGESDKPILFNGGTASREAYDIKGDLQSWKENVASLAFGNEFQMLTVGIALAAPMIPLVNTDGFGIHLYAQSTSGKTTAQDLAASLYGDPESQRLSWYGTALGIANEAEAHNHGLMALDEIGESNPQSVHTCAYTLFNGKGKLQGHKDGGNREQKYWKTAVISTGECDIETYLKQVGIKSNAGQLVRLLNMPVTRPTEFHGYQNGKAHADALKAAWIENHGAAGREWIKHLASQKEEALNAFKAAKKRWQSLIPEHFGEQVMRVTDRFAVIEAALTLGEVITGWNPYSCQEALQKVFKRWLSVFGGGNKEYEQIIEQADGFLSSFGLSRFAPLDYDEKSLPIRDLAGYRVIKPNQPVEYYVFPQVFKEQIAKGFNHTQFAKTLHEAGMLQKPTSGKGYQVITPRLKHLGGVRQRTYLLKQIVEDGE